MLTHASDSNDERRFEIDFIYGKRRNVEILDNEYELLRI